MSNETLQRFGLILVEDFLDRATCAAMRARVRANAHIAATVTRGANIEVDETTRRTKRALVDETTETQIKQRFLDLMPRLAAHFKCELTNCTAPQFLIYRQGDFFEPHTDASTRDDARADVRARRISAVLFLNDARDLSDTKETSDTNDTASVSASLNDDSFVGGALTFYSLLGTDERLRAIGFPVQARAGMFIAFPSDVFHEVTPVTQGERFTVVTWYNGKK